MIKLVQIADDGGTRVICEIKCKRGIGKDAKELLIYQFNRFKHPNLYHSIMKEVGWDDKNTKG